jgi:hypothetical protein
LVDPLFDSIINGLGEKGIYIPKEGSSFNANVVAMQANSANRKKREILNDILNKDENKANIQVEIINNKLSNSNEEYRSMGDEVSAGYNYEIETGVNLEPFVFYNNTSIDQTGKGETDKGKVNNIGFGVAEKVTAGNAFINFVLMYTRAEIMMEREEGGSKAKGKTEVDTGLLAVGLGSTVEAVKGVEVTPHIGMTITNTQSGRYKEKGDKNALDVKESEKNKINVDLGLGFTGELNKKLSWTARAGAEINLRGSKQELSAKGDSAFYGKRDMIGTEYKGEVPIRSKNIEEGKFLLEGGAGVAYNLNRNLTLNTEVAGVKGDNFSEVRGRVGLDMKVGKGKDRKAEFKAMEKAKERMLLIAKEGTEDKKENIENELRKKKEKLAKKKENIENKLKKEEQKLMKKKKEDEKKIKKM